MYTETLLNLICWVIRRPLCMTDRLNEKSYLQRTIQNIAKKCSKLWLEPASCFSDVTLYAPVCLFTELTTQCHLSTERYLHHTRSQGSAYKWQCKISKANTLISQKKKVRRPTASTYCLCWKDVDETPPFQRRMYMRAVVCKVTQRVVRSWRRRFLPLRTYNIVSICVIYVYNVYMYMHPLCSLSGYRPNLNIIIISYFRYVLNFNVRFVKYKLCTHINGAPIIQNVTRLVTALHIYLQWWPRGFAIYTNT
jgi:hypothetical protein